MMLKPLKPQISILAISVCALLLMLTPVLAADAPPAAGNTAAQRAETQSGTVPMGPGMMSQYGMGPGMMGQYGMGPGFMQMADMPMMDVLTGEHLEGRLAVLHTEIKITDAQNKLWNDFAAALRADAKHLDEVSDVLEAEHAKTPRPTVAQQLDQQERWYAARLEGIRAKKTAFAPLYAALSADQKKTADELVAPHLGLMPRMMSQGTVTPK